MKKTLLQGVCRGNRVRMVALLAIAFLTAFSYQAIAQDQDDPPGRVARLGYMEGSVSFQPAGEDEWVEAVPNRPMTTGDKLWADRDSRAEVQLGSATLDLAPNTGFSFLNLDDRTIQIQLSSGSLKIRLWDLDRDTVFEIDTPNQAFTIERPGRYRLDASEDGNYTVITVREGEGESTGNGQSYTMHAGQRFTFSGTSSLNAEVDQIGGPDDFDNWSDRRERRYEDSPSARYCSRRVVGFEDLDDNGDWQSTPEYGYAWFPRVEPGWAPYHTGHWAWIDPWGWTWVDDARWGYAPFHYGRWVSMEGRWGWIPGPREERPVYAPALVAFVGGAAVAGGAVAWFPLGPREVYVPSYRVSPTYVNRVNISNTTVNQTTVTNVYNTTIVNNNTTINNVTYVNRNVNGAVTAVPQRAFASAQPVARNAVAVNQSQLRAGPVSARAAVPPAREAVLGAHATTAGRVAAPPQAVASRQVVAKAAPPPPRPPFAARQQQLTQHPGQPIARQEMQKMAQAKTAAAPPVRQAPPAKPATPTQASTNRPGNQPGNPGGNARPGGNPPPAAQPGANNRPEPGRPNEPPARNDRPGIAQPNNRPQPNQPATNNRPEPNGPARNDRPAAAQPNNRPQPAPAPNNRPGSARPAEPPARNDRPPAAQPNNRPDPTPAPNNRPESARPSEPPSRNDRPAPQPNNRPDPNQPRSNQPMPDNRSNPDRPDMNRPQPNRAEPPARNDRPSEQPRTEPAPRPQNPPPSERPQSRQPEARPAPPERPQAQPQRQASPPDRPQAQPQRQAPPQKDQKKEDKKPQ